MTQCNSYYLAHQIVDDLFELDGEIEKSEFEQHQKRLLARNPYPICFPI